MSRHIANVEATRTRNWINNARRDEKDVSFRDVDLASVVVVVVVVFSIVCPDTRVSRDARFSLLVSEFGLLIVGRRDTARGIVTILYGSQLPPDRVSHRGHVRPVEAAAAQQHVPDERLDRRFSYQPYEEELLDHLRRDRPQRRQS